MKEESKENQSNKQLNQVVEALRQSERELRIRNKISHIFLTIPDDEMYAGVLQVILKAMDSKYGFFGYIDLDNGSLVCPSLTKDIWDECQMSDKDIVFPKDKWWGIWGQALKEKRSRYSNETLSVPQGHIPIERALVVPVIHQRKLIGEIAVANKSTDYDDKDQLLLETIANHIAPVLHARLQRDKQEKQRKQAESACKKAKEKAESASNAKSQFLASMSHELRTPLNSILGFSQLMESDPAEPLSESQKESIDQILKSGRHLLQLVNDVLDLSRIESGRMQISMETVDAAPLMVEALNIIKPMAEGRGVKLKDHICECDCPLVIADYARLKQVLLNLLSNAVKYNKVGGSVSLFCKETADGNMRINVIDTGMGIAENKLENLFKPFDRLGAETTEEEGTGIGLTITERLVNLMGGTIGVESTPGSGSCFYVDLVKGEKVVSKGRKKKMTADSILETGEEKNMVLYIEDNPASQDLVKGILKRRPNISLLCAPQAQLGIELACAHRPELIILDINLPEMDGYEALNRLQSYEETKNIPVVALTASAMPNDVERGLKAGFLHYMVKPIDISKVLEVVDSILS